MFLIRTNSCVVVQLIIRQFWWGIPVTMSAAVTASMTLRLSAAVQMRRSWRYNRRIHPAVSGISLQVSSVHNSMSYFAEWISWHFFVVWVQLYISVFRYVKLYVWLHLLKKKKKELLISLLAANFPFSIFLWMVKGSLC